MCQIDFSIAEAGNIDLSVYNLKGQKVTTISNEYFDQGDHTVYWNGNTNSGQASSGMYFYVLKTKDESIHQKMLIIK